MVTFHFNLLLESYSHDHTVVSNVIDCHKIVRKKNMYVTPFAGVQTEPSCAKTTPGDALVGRACKGEPVKYDAGSLAGVTE